MAALGDAHGDAFLGHVRPGDADETEHDLVARLDRILEERQLLAPRIRKDGLGHRGSGAVRGQGRAPTGRGWAWVSEAAISARVGKAVK